MKIFVDLITFLILGLRPHLFFPDVILIPVALMKMSHQKKAIVS